MRNSDTDVVTIVDVRNVPLSQLDEDADARDLVGLVMASVHGPSLVIVAGFNAAVS
jgi:hypothetical protein